MAFSCSSSNKSSRELTAVTGIAASLSATFHSAVVRVAIISPNQSYTSCALSTRADWLENLGSSFNPGWPAISNIRRQFSSLYGSTARKPSLVAYGRLPVLSSRAYPIWPSRGSNAAPYKCSIITLSTRLSNIGTSIDCPFPFRSLHTSAAKTAASKLYDVVLSATIVGTKRG